MVPIKPFHLYLLLLAAIVALPVFLIDRPLSPDPVDPLSEQVSRPVTHNEMPGAYHWKTTYLPDHAFLKRHGIRRLYLRMFDVDVDPDNRSEAIPIATTRIAPSTSDSKADSIIYVPTVYITLDALKSAKGNEAELAEKIVTRVANMSSYHSDALSAIEALQLDCDWTASTRESFFALCREVAEEIDSRDLPWGLSSTIRLHQLRQDPPPVDFGVLMVYNTGSFSDPDATNSIISLRDVEPYLKFLPSYPLQLDVAYPTYRWQLLFRNRQFIGLLDGLEVDDPERFAPANANSFRALTDIPFRNTIIRKGDLIRCETSDYSEILPIKQLIEQCLANRPHSNIIYHLDPKNLSTYSPDEIDSLLSAAPAR